MSVRLVPTVLDLFGEHPRACRMSAELVVGLLWILRSTPTRMGRLTPTRRPTSWRSWMRRGGGMGGNRSAAEEDDRGLERRTVELASIEWEARAEELRETWRTRCPRVTL